MDKVSSSSLEVAFDFTGFWVIISFDCWLFTEDIDERDFLSVEDELVDAVLSLIIKDASDVDDLDNCFSVSASSINNFDTGWSSSEIELDDDESNRFNVAEDEDLLDWIWLSLFLTKAIDKDELDFFDEVLVEDLVG